MRTTIAAEIDEAKRQIMGFGWSEAVFSLAVKNGEADSKTKKRIRARKIAGRNKRGKNADDCVWFIQLEEIVDKKAMHRNYSVAEFERVLADSILPECFAGEFFSTDEILSLKKNKRGEISFLRSANKRKPKTEFSTHDRPKKYLLPENKPLPFLVDLGVMSHDGKIVEAKHDKFRQINRFLEFIDDVLPQIKKIARRNGEFTIADFGCGKSSLTFAVYHFLKIKEKLPIQITGLDLKSEIIDECNSLAEKYGYDSLKFQCGDIEDFSRTNRFDMMITLHACDTATDAALAKAISGGARIILSVPCCQHELNSQLEKKVHQNESGESDTLMPVFKYGILRERAAAIFTDALRATLLTENGYNVQILEFIDTRHTPKNILIRAVKMERENESATQKANEEYRRMKEFLGVKPSLETMLTRGEKA